LRGVGISILLSLMVGMKRGITKAGRRNGKIFEFNLKYKVPDDEFIKMLREENIPMSIGNDAHSVEELKKSIGVAMVYHNLANIFL